MATLQKKSIFGKKTVDMTRGSIFRHLVSFAVPLMIGYVFQQLYNTVDTWVVGNYVSNEAFSAVGTVSPIINMLIGLFTGLAGGAGVVISQYFGAHRDDKVSDAVHTSIVITVLMSVVFTAIGIVATPFMLRLMDQPPEVIPESTAYLTIYFAGVIGLMVYNMGAGIMRAVGDSVRPFVFLVVSALLNIGLDLLFVLVFGMGVKGVAYATIISQGISAILVIISLMRTDSCIRLHIRKLKIDPESMVKILRVGLPSALQMALTAFSNIFVQSYINYFGTDFMSGWAAYLKIDQIILIPMQSIALGTTTFVGQNLGKRNVKRAKKGVWIAIMLSICSTGLLSIPVMIFAPELTAFFNSANSDVIQNGALLLRLISPFYILCCTNQIYACALRGSGNSKVPMIIMLSSFVLFRQCYLYVMANFISNTMIPIALSYPAGWLVCSAAEMIYYHKVGIEKNKLIDDSELVEEEVNA